MAEVDWGVYCRDKDGLSVLQGKECVGRPAAVPVPDGEAWVGAGSGWETYGAELMELAGERVTRVLPDLEPGARDLARLAADKFARGEVVRAAEAVPIYLRDNVVRVR